MKKTGIACIGVLGLLLATPPAPAALITLGTNPGDSATVNGAVFTVSNAQSAGTGLIDSFLRIQNDGTEKGYNTGTPRNSFPSGFPDFNQKKGNFTYDIQLGTVPKTTDGNYRRILLDINEPGGSQATLDLERLLVFVGGGPNAFINGDESQLVDDGPLGSLVFDLDSNGDQTVRFTDVFAGSGQFDAAIDIPESLFTGKNASEVFRIFAQFSNAEGGFEEFAVKGTGGGAGPGGSGGPIDPPSFQADPVPEPTTLALFGLGTLGLAGWRLRRQHAPR
jgi:hypothetical protein